MKKCMMAATLVCGTTMTVSSCSDKKETPALTGIEAEYPNKKITDGNYDKTLAVKCINGTFVGKKAENNVVVYKGIPFVGEQPVGNLRWKAPVDVIPDDNVYEAYNYSKTPAQSPGDPAEEYGTSEECLYLNVWKSAEDTAVKKPVIVWI